MFEIFIRRPILSGVISVVIVFLGLLAITSLPITQFPDYPVSRYCSAFRYGDGPLYGSQCRCDG